MPPFGPTKRADLVRALRRAGFAGPIPGGRHEFMVKGALKLTLPNPHRGDIGRPLLAEILRQAGLSRDEWEKL
ncbi:MAG: type II toxin-antitoxin system HicA family toxin [Planctomycetota bacterium]|nr:type II toxin-antitoxin system HicA family toxin [Planctomycetota bacterium]